MTLKSIWLAASVILAAATLNAQQPVYWSATQPNCGNFSTVAIQNGNVTIGYSCEVTGTLSWYAVGGGWVSAVRVAAPNAGPIGVYYNYLDTTGNPVALDSTYLDSAGTNSDTGFSFALYADQSSEVDLLGLSSDPLTYPTLADGNVEVAIDCADQDTCSQVSAQLIYSVTGEPWSLSVPVTWGGGYGLVPQNSFVWAGSGVDDTATGKILSYVISNQDLTTDNTYQVYLYDDNGTMLAGSPVIVTVPAGGSKGALIRNLGINMSGVQGTMVKVLVVQVDQVDASPAFSFLLLQFNGRSATAVVTSAEDTYPTLGAPTVKGQLNPHTGVPIRTRTRQAVSYRGTSRPQTGNR